MKSILAFFRGLRGKLILTYTLVTVLALLALEATIIAMVLLITSSSNTDRGAYLSDVVYVLYPQAQGYLQPGHENLSGLQAWLDSVYASGQASLPPQDLVDSPAAMINKSDPMFVISPQGTILAQSPPQDNSLVGRQYVSPDYVDGQKILDTAWRGDFNALDLYAVQPDGTYLMAVPIPETTRDTPLVGAIILSVDPPPSRTLDYWPYFFLVLVGTGLLLLVAVTPFGALFGFIMSRGLTRRLKALTQAVDAWGEGDFSLQPQDRSQDEISYLGRRMRHMAERVQNLLQTQHELAMMEERNRLARELHDTVKQQSFATMMQVRAAKNLVDHDPAAALQHLEEAENLIKTSQQELGRMIAEARPAALEGQGLSQALEKYVENWSKNACIPADFQIRNERRLPLEIEQALYRLSQEALSNVSRHSRASAATIRLTFEDRRVVLEIADNGTGFDLEPAMKQGFGLQNMHERIAALGGLVTIKTSADEGTTVSAIVDI